MPIDLEALPRSKNTHLFTLRVHPVVGSGLIIVEAHDGGDWPPCHRRINIEVRHGGRVIFPFGFLYCGVSSSTAVDGDDAKALTLETVAVKPGDTDSAYFEGYTPEQLEWASRYGEHLSCVALDRYGGL